MKGFGTSLLKVSLAALMLSYSTVDAKVVKAVQLTKMDAEAVFQEHA